MITRLLRDASERPDLFLWVGPVDAESLHTWSARKGIRLHPDIVELLTGTGGGDVFETEAILCPAGVQGIGDNADEMNEQHWGRGMPKEYWLFHVGLVLSAVRQSDGALVSLSDSYGVIDTYASLDDWYVNVLRAEYADRYGLSSTDP